VLLVHAFLFCVCCFAFCLLLWLFVSFISCWCFFDCLFVSLREWKLPHHLSHGGAIRDTRRPTLGTEDRPCRGGGGPLFVTRLMENDYFLGKTRTRVCVIFLDHIGPTFCYTSNGFSCFPTFSDLCSTSNGFSCLTSQFYTLLRAKVNILLEVLQKSTVKKRQVL